MIEELERKLDSFEPAERKEALELLVEKTRSGEISLPEPGIYSNMHSHTFFSYNAYGYSPTKFAWRARTAALAVVAIVDFDVLDGLEEFLDAARLLDLKACVGTETRVFVPEFAQRVINSPGEPGISYHVGMGFTTSRLEGQSEKFLNRLRKIAEQRNLDLMAQVNKYLSPVELDYKKDVCPLTPSGNPTERHICLAYARKAKTIFSDDKKLAQFWAKKLSASADRLDLPEGLILLNLIRAKTMKRGGVGYVQPDKKSFPKMAEMNEFILAAGAVPTIAWLDGTSQAEQSIEELFEVAMSTGAAAVMVMPARNYEADKPLNRDEKLQNLYALIDLAAELHLPVLAGTEMNSPGQRFVDDFNSPQLSPLLPAFLQGAHIMYAHSVLQQKAPLGYTSQWAQENFADTAAKNDFFETVGKLLQPRNEDLLTDLDENVLPQQILEKIEA